MKLLMKINILGNKLSLLIYQFSNLNLINFFTCYIKIRWIIEGNMIAKYVHIIFFN
jgi:hypothetical protein